ncbi:N-acetylglucosaminyl-diphospho-decaprenol L-rhamnosyltransferase [Mariniflexile rhizosphaerae]|uniref:glycosyltransferase family 2 protein n=1 Tax=unclassified Mariniflexile TaxID=2643887 RepID=UPI000CAA2AB0|nr:glycosyltransferase family 2 protein [Mariniflexile sp. TRM1-10]AXP82361.1 N-acetylglucosaminyl-diphospho-decaprenol L-rhamnosyltransferase [Mariniflexile sp. TRM1-10]PLB20461.1 MAG: Glycosyl transferase family 2 [Flavobacteriaceae bacterium FS1-H7996/R]
MAELKIAIVILNWNGKKLLEQFLPSVIEYSKEATVYVADNASTDDSVSFVKTAFPLIEIIQNKENGGYAKGYNDALKHIEADIFCLLNSDVEVTVNWLSPIIETFTNEFNTAIIQPKLLDFNKRDYFEYAGAAGGFIDKYGYPYCRGRIFNTIEKDNGQYNDTTEVFWASGACLFIRKYVFNELNGLDEAFFAHMEEIDLCWRAKNLGYAVKYVGQSTIYHVGGATLNNANPKKTFLNFRNSLYTLTKNAKGNIFLIILIRLVLDGIAGIKFLVELKPKHTLAVLKAHFSFYAHLKQLLRQRKSVKNKIIYYQKTSIVLDYFVNSNVNYKS